MQHTSFVVGLLVLRLPCAGVFPALCLQKCRTFFCWPKMLFSEGERAPNRRRLSFVRSVFTQLLNFCSSILPRTIVCDAPLSPQLFISYQPEKKVDISVYFSSCSVVPVCCVFENMWTPYCLTLSLILQCLCHSRFTAI